jgi:hypothetical protein
MPEGVARFLEEWHRIVSKKDQGALRGILAEDVSLGAPPYASSRWNSRAASASSSSRESI